LLGIAFQTYFRPEQQQCLSAMRKYFIAMAGT